MKTLNKEKCLKAIRKVRATVALTQLQKRSVERGLDKLRSQIIEDEIKAARRRRGSKT
jgi:hypothetical protein